MKHVAFLVLTTLRAEHFDIQKKRSHAGKRRRIEDSDDDVVVPTRSERWLPFSARRIFTYFCYLA